VWTKSDRVQGPTYLGLKTVALPSLQLLYDFQTDVQKKNVALVNLRIGFRPNPFTFLCSLLQGFTAVALNRLLFSGKD